MPERLVFYAHSFYHPAMCFKNKTRPQALQFLLLASAVAAAALLAVALVAQYGFGLAPCELCMAQRYPYMAVIVVGAAGRLLGKPERLLWACALLCCGLFAADACIAWYHAGVEWGVFAGPTACTSSGSAGQSLEEMRREIMNAALVPCNQPMVHFLGLSMAAWNGIAATLLALASVVTLRKIRKGTS